MKRETDNNSLAVNRRDVIKSLFTLAAAYTATGCRRDADALSSFFHTHFQEMSEEKIASTMKMWEILLHKKPIHPGGVCEAELSGQKCTDRSHETLTALPC